MAQSRWTSKNYREFKPGDIICNAKDQSFLRIVVKVEEDTLWCAGFVHAALTENMDKQPVFPIPFTEIEWNAEQCGETLLRLGNLDDYKAFIERVQDECYYNDDRKD